MLSISKMILLEGRPEKITNGNLISGDLTGYIVQTVGTGTTEYLDGAIHLVGTDSSNRGKIRQTINGLVIGRPYTLSFDRTLTSGSGTIGISSSSSSNVADLLALGLTGAAAGTFIATATTLYFLSLPGSGGGNYSVDNISVK